MKENNHAAAKKVLILSIAVLLGLLLYTSVKENFFLSDMLGFVGTPMQNISAKTTDNVKEFLDLDNQTREELKALSEQLLEENQILRNQLNDYESIKKENESLKEMLSIQEEQPDIRTVPAFVSARNPTDIFYGFSIDKGYLAGISKGDPVITKKGLVGRVSEVYATTCKVTTILSENLRVSAFSQKYDESGVIGSDIIFAGNGLLRMTYLKNDTKIQPGTVITASGANGAYPKNTAIGYVTEVRNSEYDISKYAIVQPYEDVKTVKHVFVIVGFPGKDAPQADFSEESASSDIEDAEAES